MCAYNIRRSRRVDHDPVSGYRRALNLMREVLTWGLGAAVLYGVYRLVMIFLF
jgi:hypothetical protein